MKKRKLGLILSAIMLSAMAVSLNVSAGSTGQHVVNVGTGQVWKYDQNVTRTTAYSYVSSYLYSVYPTDGSPDNFTKLHTQLRNSSGTVITKDEYAILTENGGSSSYSVSIKEGYLNVTPVYIYYRGNNANYSAGASVATDGK